MAFRYTRVKDKATGHEYDVLSHKVDPTKHDRVDPRRYPEVTAPRPAKPNVKSRRPAQTEKASGASKRATSAKKSAPQAASGGQPATAGGDPS